MRLKNDEASKHLFRMLFSSSCFSDIKKIYKNSIEIEERLHVCALPALIHIEGGTIEENIEFTYGGSFRNDVTGSISFFRSTLLLMHYLHVEQLQPSLILIYQTS